MKTAQENKSQKLNRNQRSLLVKNVVMRPMRKRPVEKELVQCVIEKIKSETGAVKSIAKANCYVSRIEADFKSDLDDVKARGSTAAERKISSN